MPETIKFDPNDREHMVGLMDRASEFDKMLFGKNTKGEGVMLSIGADNIVCRTQQSNGWDRVNTYWRDGTEEETFER